MSNKKNFTKKTVVITGAGSGIGRAYAKAFGKLGSRLSLNDYDKNSLEQTASILHELGVKKENIYFEAFDVSDKSSVEKFSRHSKKIFGNAYVVLNNAGIEGENKPFYCSSEAHLKKVMDVNFWGTYYITTNFLPQLVEENKGALVNTSSIFGLIGAPNASDYCASKFAVRGFTESIMVELAESPIQIHCLHPGGIATNIVRDKNYKHFEDSYLKTSPDDIAHHVIKCIEKNKSRIVYGNDSFKTYLGSRVLPLKLLSKITWKQTKFLVTQNQILKKDYKKFLKKEIV